MSQKPKIYLNREIFKTKITQIKNVFRLDMDLSLDIIRLYYDFLKDLETEKFENAVNDLIMQEKQIYSNTNIIALIREYYDNWVPNIYKPIMKGVKDVRKKY